MSRPATVVGGYASLWRAKQQGRAIATSVRDDGVPCGLEAPRGRALASFHFLRLPPGSDLSRLTRPSLVLDRSTLDRHYREAPHALGAIDAKAGSRFSRRVALGLARSCGRQLQAETGIDPGVAAKAWFFAIWTEVCILVPARHLARRLARLAGDDLILLPLASPCFNYLGYWEPNHLEPFYLAAELRKHGAAVAFVLTDGDAPDRGEKREDVVLRFSPHPFCLPRSHAAELTSDGSRSMTALVGAGIRGIDIVQSRLSGARVVESLFTVAPMRHDLGLFSGSEPPPTLTVGLREVPGSSGPSSLRMFRSEPRILALPDLLAECVGRATKEASDHAETLVGRLGLRELHICDHGFVESALMAHAVRRWGGQVFLWPHSSNAVHPELRDPGDITAITCATRAAAKTWQSHCPGVPCRVESALMFPRVAEPAARVPGQPLTVVVIGGAHALRRMPLVARDAHAASYRSFFRGLAALVPTVRIVFKPKSVWETTDWLREIVGNDILFDETSSHPNQIDEPNMVFATVSLGSSALLEGVSRGIPCLVVRDTPVEDYVGLDPKAVPIGDTAASLAVVASLQNDGAYEALLRRERTWLRYETGGTLLVSEDDFKPSAEP